jgi:anthranilate synthase component 1
MQIIDELEPQARGLYGGALGYIDLRGNLDFCIAIRTLILKAGKATLQTGAGIVADSDPAYEERETEAKAQALFEALKVAGGLA